MSVQYALLLNFDNILAHPKGMIFLSSFSVFFILLSIVAKCRDSKLDQHGIQQTFQLLEAEVALF